jgi:hypothetical protein
MLGQSIYGIEPFGAAPAYVAPTPPAGPVGENALFLSSQPFDRATIVGSSEIPTLPASYLRDFRVERKWRLASKKDQYLAVTLDRALACDTVAIIGGNGSASFLGRILAATSLAALPASPEFDSGWMSAWPLTGKPVLDEPWPVFTNLFRFENTTAYRYWWLLLADPSAENSYMEYGRILIGKAFQPRFNVDINPALGLESPDVRRRSPFGRTFASPRGHPLGVWRSRCRRSDETTSRRVCLSFSVTAGSGVTSCSRSIRPIRPFSTSTPCRPCSPRARSTRRNPCGTPMVRSGGPRFRLSSHFRGSQR